MIVCHCLRPEAVIMSNILVTFLRFRSRWCCSFVGTSWIRRTSSESRILFLSFTAVMKTARKLTGSFLCGVCDRQFTDFTKQLSEFTYTTSKDAYRRWAWFFHAPKSSHTEDIRSEVPMWCYIIVGAVYVTSSVQTLTGQSSRKKDEQR